MNKILSIQEQACIWLSLQDEKHSSFKQEELLSWLNEKEEHYFAFEKEKSLKRKIKNLSKDILKELSQEIFEELKIEKKRKHLFKTILPYTIAASLLLLLSSGIFTYYKKEEILFQRSYMSQQKVIKNILLKDQSIISLDSNTKLSIKYYKNTREVNLEQGSVVFSVHSNKSRPFIIKTNHTSIEVLGTTFEVSNINGFVNIKVKEGKVKIAKIYNINKEGKILALLKKGEKISLNKQGDVLKLTHLDVNTIALWEQGKLIFEQTPLKEVMNEFAKYLDIKINFENTLLESYLISGEFDVNGFDNLLTTLPLIHPIHIRKNKNIVYIKNKFQNK